MSKVKHIAVNEDTHYRFELAKMKHKARAGSTNQNDFLVVLLESHNKLNRILEDNGNRVD
jgi:hypothetical protein